MFALEVEYLTGRAVATTRHRREEAEWPPHPGRLFSALVDAAFQAVSDDGSELPGIVRKALEWLERLEPPALAVSEARRRDIVSNFVPANDHNNQFKVGAKGKISIFPALNDGIAIRRLRNERFFPAVVPDCSLVHFVWENAPEGEVATHRPALERVVECVTYLGHSSSLVRVAVSDTHGPLSYRPDPNGQHTLRVPGRGRLANLIGHYRRGARPSPGLYAAYAKLDEMTKTTALVEAVSVFGDTIACEIDGPFLPLVGATKFLNAVRDALIRATDAESQVVKELVSGHTADGGRSREEHVAYVPLANVGFNRYSDGKVMGFGLVLPRGLTRFSAERRAILRAVAGLEAIGFGGHSWRVAIPTENVPKSLQSWAYTNPACVWATVTPILCDRFPKDKDGERLEDIIAESVERVAGVRPVRIVWDKISKHLGVAPSHEFPNRRKPDDQPRHRVHAFIEFDREVRGPLIVGAGRYHGMGLFRVWTTEGRQ